MLKNNEFKDGELFRDRDGSIGMVLHQTHPTVRSWKTYGNYPVYLVELNGMSEYRSSIWMGKLAVWENALAIITRFIIGLRKAFRNEVISR